MAYAALSVYLHDGVDLADKQQARHKPNGACVLVQENKVASDVSRPFLQDISVNTYVDGQCIAGLLMKEGWFLVETWAQLCYCSRALLSIAQ